MRDAALPPTGRHPVHMPECPVAHEPEPRTLARGLGSYRRMSGGGYRHSEGILDLLLGKTSDTSEGNDCLGVHILRC